jgi:hypothetical protein
VGQTTAAQDTLEGAGYDDRILWSVAPILFRAVAWRGLSLWEIEPSRAPACIVTDGRQRNAKPF